MLIAAAGIVITPACFAAPAQQSYNYSADDINNLINTYNAGQNSIDIGTASPAIKDFKTERMIKDRKNSDSLCDILADPSFSIPSLDWDNIESAWSSFTAAAAAKAKGINFSAAMSLVNKKAMEKMWSHVKGGTCKMVQKAGHSLDHSINKAYDKSKQNGIDGVINSKDAKTASLNDLSKDGLTNIAAKQTQEKLKDYDSYGRWYEKGYLSDKVLSHNIDSIITNQINKSKDDVINKYAPPSKTLMDKADSTIKGELNL